PTRAFCLTPFRPIRILLLCDARKACPPTVFLDGKPTGVSMIETKHGVVRMKRVGGWIAALVLLSVPAYAFADTFTYNWTLPSVAGWTFGVSSSNGNDNNILSITPPTSITTNTNFTFTATVTNNSGADAPLGGGGSGGALFNGLDQFTIAG